MNESKSKITKTDISIGRNLRAMREFAGMSQKELADILDVTFQQLQKYEQGKNRLPAARLFTLTRYFNVPFENFFDGVDDINGPDMDLIKSDKLSIEIFQKVRALKDETLKCRISRVITALTAPL